MTADCNATSLSLSWQQPEGDLDALVVTLSTNGTTCWEATLPPDATEVVVDQLTPSSAYQVVVTSRSGKLTNQSETTVRTGDVLFRFSFRFLFLCFNRPVFVPPPAPAPATLLSLSPSSPSGLLLSWTPPAGQWESYTLLLFDGSQQLVRTALGREAVNYSFPGTGLTPGRLYRAVLRVESGGGLWTDSSCEGATGPFTRRHTRRNTIHAHRHVTCRLRSSRAGARPPHTALGRDLAQRHVEPRPLRVT